MARREARMYPCGLFCYRVEDDLRLGKVLMADSFVAVDLLDAGVVLAALAQELDTLANRHGCQAVRSLAHGGASSRVGDLSAAGHHHDGSLLLEKLLVAPPPRRTIAGKSAQAAAV